MYKAFKSSLHEAVNGTSQKLSNPQVVRMAGAMEGATSSGGRKVLKSHKSSVILMPPESVWEQIQEIRKVHDPVFKRWMPHVNLCYPFIPDERDTDGGAAFRDAARRCADALSDLRPFRVVVTRDSFQTFSHKKFQTMWLRFLDPERAAAGLTDAPHDGVLQIHARLERAFPEYCDLSHILDAHVFTPHLSLGRFKHKEVASCMERFQADWADIEFEIAHVHLISRADADDPFHVRHTVMLGQKPEIDDT